MHTITSSQDEFTNLYPFFFSQTVALLQFRLYMMGYSLPTFKEEDNPASFSPHLNTRILSYIHLIAFNAQLLLSPSVLCYDWQVGSIPLVESLTDARNFHSLLCVSILMVLSVNLLIRILKEKVTRLILKFNSTLPQSKYYLRVV